MRLFFISLIFLLTSCTNPSYYEATVTPDLRTSVVFDLYLKEDISKLKLLLFADTWLLSRSQVLSPSELKEIQGRILLEKSMINTLQLEKKIITAKTLQ